MGTLDNITIAQLSQLRALADKMKRKQKATKRVAIGLLKKKKSEQLPLYVESATNITEFSLSKLETQSLLGRNFIKYLSEKEGRIIITLKGLLIVEYNMSKLDAGVEEMIDDLNKEYFEGALNLTSESMSSVEKAIALSLLGLGAVSSRYPVVPDERNNDIVKTCVDLAVDFLRSLGNQYWDTKLDRIWDKDVRGEGPVLGLIRRLDTIQLHTEGIYQKDAHGGHYLGILADDLVNDRDLRYLLGKIFDKRPLILSERHNLVATLDKIQGYAYKIFREDPPFSMIDVRERIREIITD